MDARIDAVRVAGTPNGPVPVVLVGVADDPGVVPIFVGFDEATSIARGIDAVDTGRPLTHDLLLNLVEALGSRIDRVVISDLRDGTYIADLHVVTPRGTEVVDARPSDSLALAARTNAPIEIASSVFETAREDPDRFADLPDLRAVIGGDASPAPIPDVSGDDERPSGTAPSGRPPDPESDATPDPDLDPDPDADVEVDIEVDVDPDADPDDPDDTGEGDGGGPGVR